MTNPRIKLKRSSVLGKVPTDSDLQHGELALNFRDRKLYFKDANNDIVAFIDSGAVQNLIDKIDATAQAQLDSDEVFQIIDSAYVNARLDLATILDSAEIKDFIDSDYIRNKIDEAFTNSFTIDAETLNGESADYYLNYNNFSNTPTILDSAMITRFTLDSSEIIQLIDSAHVIARFGDSAANATEAYRFGGNDPAYYLAWDNVTNKPTILDNVDVVNLIDSAHVQARQRNYSTADFADSAFVTGLPVSTFQNDQNYIDTAGAYASIDSNYIQDRQIKYNTSDFLDSDTVSLVVDSAYVRNRQQKYNTSDFLDSNTVTYVVNGAYVKARQTTYNTSDFLDSETVTYVVDSQYVRDRIGSTIDSAGVETIIDSAYINARVDEVAQGTDSSTVSAIILNDVDSAYVQARQTATTQDFSYTSLTNLPDFFDSSDAQTLVDSAYVRARIGSTIDSAYFDTNIPKFGTDYVDSAAVIKIIGDEGIDSDLITNLVDSAYIALRDRFQDSDGVISLIDSAFVRVRIGSTIDSAGVETLVDSAYVNLRADQYDNFDADFTAKSTSDLSEGSNLYYTKARADSDIAASINDSGNTVSITITNTITDKVDSAYVLARVNEAPFLDSYYTTALVDSTYVQARQSAETDTLATVTGRGATTTTNVTFNGTGNSILIGDTLRIDSAGSGFRMTNVGAFDKNGDDFRVFGTKGLKIGAGGEGNIAITIDSAQRNVTIENDLIYRGQTVTIYESASVTSIIDSAYVQARETAQDFAYSSLTGAPTIPTFGTDFVDSAFVTSQGYITSSSLPTLGTDFVDSEQVELIIDSDYVQARTTAGTDSAATIALIESTVDSSYVQSRETAQDFAYGSLTGAPVVFDSEMVDDIIDSNVRNELFQNVNTIGPDNLGTNNYGVYIGRLSAAGVASSDQFNVHIGALAGQDVHNTDDNVYVGYNAGGTAGGQKNVAIGKDANLKADGSNTVVIGSNADATSGTVAIGQRANTGVGAIAIGYRAEAPETNTAIGYEAGETDLDSGNVIIGYQAGMHTSSTDPGGSRNIAIGNKTLGTLAGSSNGLQSEALNNVLIGHEAGGRLQRGADNIVIGKSNAGSTLNFGNNNIIIGVNAGNTISSWAATSNVIAIGDSSIDRLIIEGLGIDTEKADSGQTLIWDNAAGEFYFGTVATGDAGLDSALTVDLIEATVTSAYIQTRQGLIDSDLVTQLVDSAYIALRDRFQDSDGVIALIDSDFVQARQLDSAATATNALNLNNQPGSYYLDYNNFTATPTIPTVDKATIDALNVDADTLDNQDGTYYLNYNNFTNTPTVLNATGVKDIFNSNGDNQIETGAVVGTEFLEFIHDSDVTTFLVDVGSKTNAHRYDGTGSSNGYVIRNQESPFLQFVPGNKYRFDQAAAANASHQIRFYYDAAKTTEYTTNVTFNGTAGSAGAYTEIEITDNTPSVLHYQCINHGYMGNAIFVQTRNFTGFETDDLTEGSSNLYYTNARVQTLVDSSYVRTRIGSTVDSSGVESIIDSAYINLRVDFDSSSVIDIVDSSYVSARQSYDSALVGQQIINTVDSAFVQLREASGSGGALNAFKNIVVAGQDSIVASGVADDFTFLAGTNITLVTEASTNTLTINSTASGGGGGAVADGLTISKFVFTADSGQTVFDDSDDDGTLLAYNHLDTQINVFLNGILQVDSDDFTMTDSSTVTLTSGANLGDILQVIKYTPPDPNASAETSGVDSAATIAIIDSAYVQSRTDIFTRGTLTVNKFFFEADSGQLVFNDLDKFGTQFTVNKNNTEVYLNGVLQEETTDYSITDSGVTFTEALDSGYSVSVIETIGRVNTRTTLSQVVYEFDADSGQVTFSGNDRDGDTISLASGAIDVYLNGILLSNRNDYTINGDAIVLEDSADSGDFLAIVKRQGLVISNLNTSAYDFTPAAGTLTLSGNNLAYSGNVQVYKNGSLLREGTDYTATDGTSVILTDSSVANDLFTVQTFMSDQLKAKSFDFIADSGQTTFRGDDRFGEAMNYLPNALTVYLNGIALVDSQDYTAANGIDLILTAAADSADEIKILTYQTADLSKQAVPMSMTQFEFTADSGQSTFSGLDDNSETLAYIVDKINVHMNGLLLPTADYTATNGTSIVLGVAADSGDVIAITKFTGNNIGLDSSEVKSVIDNTYIAGIVDSGYVQLRQGNVAIWRERTAASTLAINTKNIIDTTDSALTMTLPSGTLGDEIRVIDGVGNAATNNITLTSSAKIRGSDSDYVISSNRAGVGFVFYNDSQGWILIES